MFDWFILKGHTVNRVFDELLPVIDSILTDDFFLEMTESLDTPADENDMRDVAQNLAFMLSEYVIATTEGYCKFGRAMNARSNERERRDKLQRLLEEHWERELTRLEHDTFDCAPGGGGGMTTTKALAARGRKQ